MGISFQSIKATYLHNIQKILQDGEKVTDERGQETREIRNLISVIDVSKKQDEYLAGSIWNGEKLEEYCQQLLDPNDKGFIYDYGNRLRGFDVDQIDYIIRKLNEDKNTRRAIAVTYRPKVDTMESEVPCLILLDFKVRPVKHGCMKINKLNCTAVFRSNDMYGAYYCNAYGIYNIMTYIVNNLDFKCFRGELTTHSISAHIYETDMDNVRHLLRVN